MKKVLFYVCATLILVYFMFVGALALTFQPWKTIAQLGTFGDFFGVINCLFSGLALIIVGYTMIMQREDLESQRKDLKEQVETQRKQLEQAQKLNDLNMLNTLYGILGQENDNFSRSIKGIEILTDCEITSEDLENLRSFRDLRRDNHEKAVAIGTVLKEQFSKIVSRLQTNVTNTEKEFENVK